MDATVKIIIDGLVLSLILLQVLDAYLTIRAIRYGAHESNPVLAALQSFLQHNGVKARWAWLAVVKIAFIALIVFLFFKHVWYTPAGLILLCLANIAYCWVAVHNWNVMDKAREKKYAEGE